MKKKLVSDSGSKMCMSPHVIMHSTFGLGLGIILATLLANSFNVVTLFVIGIIFCVLGVFSHFFLS